MRSRIRSLRLLVLVLACLSLPAAARTMNGAKDVDPLAADVLKAVTEPIRNAKSYSFRALVTRELLGTNGQIVTQFSTNRVTICRPDKMRIEFQGRGQAVELTFNRGEVVLYAPGPNVYTHFSVPATISAALDALEKKRNIHLPVRNLLTSDPGKSLINDLTTAYVVGRTNLFDEKVHHLVFTEPNAEWQMWVTGGAKPRVRRLQVIDESQPHKPRTTVDFFDWDFNPIAPPSMFSFTQPKDAKQIDFLPQDKEEKP